MPLLAQSGGQTANNVSGWTTDTLKEMQQRMDELRQKFMDERQTASDKRTNEALLAVKESAALALESAKEANRKSELQSDKRFDSVNEFRKTLADQTSTFVPRPEFAAAMSSLTDKFESNTKLIMGRVDALSMRVTESQAVKTGSSEVWVSLGAIGMLIFTAIGSLISVIGFIYVLATRRRAAGAMAVQKRSPPRRR
jgi:hypothetical protein